VGFTPHFAYEVEGTGVLLALVAGGLGVALVPEPVMAVAVAGVAFRPVRGAESVELSLAWRATDDSPLLERVMTTLESAGIFQSDSTLPVGRGPSEGSSP
jgi:DNA-binding transcriptional LysR family regulator